MKHDADTDPEIMLCAVEQSGRVVVNLDHADINPIARTNVDTASECSRPSRLFFREIFRARARENRNATLLGDVHAIACMRSSE